MTTQIYREALENVRKGGANPDVHLGTHRATEPGLRVGLEQALRELASRTPDTSERLVLVDEANAIRPWSLF